MLQPAHIAGAAIVFAGALWPVRSQATVGDVAWMRSTIPLRSIAILACRRARIEDPRAGKLADQIIRSQEREIGDIKVLIRELRQRENSER